VDRDGNFGFDGSDVADGVRSLAPGGGNGDKEGLRSNWGNIKGITWVGRKVVYDEAEVGTGNFTFDDGGVVFAEKLDFEAAYFPGLAAGDSDGSAN